MKLLSLLACLLLTGCAGNRIKGHIKLAPAGIQIFEAGIEMEQTFLKENKDESNGACSNPDYCRGCL